MTVMSRMFDGEQHWLEPGEYFGDGATQVVSGWEELEEEDVLSPFESPSLTPVLRDTEHKWATPEYNKRFPLRKQEQAWGSLSVILTAFAHVAGITKKQYQHVWPGQGSVKGEVKWSFQTDEFITERM